MSHILKKDSPMCIHCLKQIGNCTCILSGWPGKLRSEVKQRVEKVPSPLLSPEDLVKRDIGDIVRASEYLERCEECKRVKNTRLICSYCGHRK